MHWKTWQGWQKPGVFQWYEQACRYGTRIIPAVHGEFGDVHMYPATGQPQILVSPLMSLYGFFDAKVVIEHSLILVAVRVAASMGEAFVLYNLFVRRLKLRPRRDLPY